ncbi:MAG TPA: hypothetical protein VMB79_05510 [Jatrophihabitans sp.]|nr:hypothetical protein [Jatrophihabitans sp.]
MHATTLVTDELHRQFPTVPLSDVARCVRQAAEDLCGSVLAPAMPEMLARLSRQRLASRHLSLAH